MTLQDAVRLGIARVRLPNWAEETCYLKIDLIEEFGKKFHGPWLHLYSPVTQKAIGEKTPQDLLCTVIPFNEDGWEAYAGEIAEGDTQGVIVIPKPLTDDEIEACVRNRGGETNALA